MQRFLRDPALNLPVEQISRAYDERMAVIRKHFPPSVASAYAIPRQGGDNCLEWWTTQQGQVRAFNAMPAEEQQALLQVYATHQAQLQSLASSLEARGMQSQARVVQSLISSANPDNLYSVENRLLIAEWRSAVSSPAATTVASPVSGRNRRWIRVSSVLLLALILFLILFGWWFWWRSATPEPAVPFAPALPALPQSDSDESTPPLWPAELVLLLDSSDIMAHSRDADGTVRMDLARHEAERILASLPEHTDTHLLYTMQGSCAASPVHYGPYTADQRAELQAKFSHIKVGGASPLAANLVAAAAAVEGRTRDALVFAFVGGPDTCGEDICAAAQAIHAQKPKLRINLVDLSGDRIVDTCVADITNGMVYFWGVTDPAHAVDLAEEASHMLIQPEMSALPADHE